MKRRICPSEAAMLLNRSKSNYRRVRPHVVSMYANDMQRGKWKYNGESIKLNSNGEVVDGQHRLQAVVVSGVEIETEVIEGVDDVLDIDNGLTRKFEDQLARLGHKNCSALASSVRWLYFYENGKTSSQSWKNSNSVLLDVLSKRPRLVDAVNERASFPPFIRLTFACVLRYCTREVNESLSDLLFNGLVNGVGMVRGNPIFTLREYLLAQHATIHHKRASNIHKFAVSVKAWNALFDDREVHLLKWSRYQGVNEEFPRINGYDELVSDTK